MSAQPFLSEIMIIGATFPPAGWAHCFGQTLPISSNNALFALLSSTYGGDGTNTFGLPDMRGRAAIDDGLGIGSLFSRGQMAGAERVTLTKAELPVHTHDVQPLNATSTVLNNTNRGPNGQVPNFFNANFYTSTPPSSSTTIGSQVILPNEGGNQAHENMQPWIAMNYCISLQGIFPPRD